MKVAVTYEDGKVFQHFGRTEQFKVYDVEDGKVVSSEVMGSNGIGHEALAFLLAEKSIDVLICGGMGAGAQAALEEAGLKVFSGTEGDADAAVGIPLVREPAFAGKQYLRPKTKNSLKERRFILDFVESTRWAA